MKSNDSIAYVEFYEVDSVSKAIGMTGTKVLGIPIIISASEFEKNVEAEKKAALAAQAAGIIYRPYGGF
jgi:RNA-binding protein 39